MFTQLSQETVSETPGKVPLYVSCIIHICALVGLTWFSVINIPKIRFDVIAVQAGSREPVREPQPLYLRAPIQNTHRMASERLKPSLRSTILPQGDKPNQAASEDGAGFTARAIPTDFVALLDTEPEPAPAVRLDQYGTRMIPHLQILESSLPPPEPPPGEPDIAPKAVIGGRLTPAELIRKTMPTYPALARTARVEGVVILEGTVNVSGSVDNVRVVEGHPLLVDEAVRAVKKWKYHPAILNGQPTPSPVTITVRFILEYSGQ